MLIYILKSNKQLFSCNQHYQLPSNSHYPPLSYLHNPNCILILYEPAPLFFRMPMRKYEIMHVACICGSCSFLSETNDALLES